MNKECILLVGPPGCGKSTFAKEMNDLDGYVRVSQDAQGPEHFDVMEEALNAGQRVVVDRMNFSKEQRQRYLKLAKEAGYKTEIVVLHQSYQTCYDRMLTRQDHETIKDEKSRRGALRTFFTKYERPADDESDRVTRIWPGFPDEPKPSAIICDLDGTLCNIAHRRHFVEKKENHKSVDWKSFFESMVMDEVNPWCESLVRALSKDHQIVYCSGRPSDYRPHTVDWLRQKKLGHLCGDHLYMRFAGDFRRDDIVKEIILDFEILTRFTPYFMIDDRQQVVDLWRKRGFVCLQCDEGNF